MSAGAPGRRGSGRLPLIDSLRAIAALSIFAYHSLFVTGNLSQRDYGAYLNFGVPLFYAISGLLLYLPFARAIESASRPPVLRDYASHRLFRIVPAYWVALPIVVIVLERAADVFRPGGILTYFGFLQIYRLETFTGGIGQAWTLCVEVTFYAFLPIWGMACMRACSRSPEPTSRMRIHLAMIVGLVVLSAVWKLAVLWLVGDDVRASLVPLTVLPAALDQFAVGLAAAVVLVHRARGGKAPSLRFRSRLPAGGVALAVLAYLMIGEVHGIGIGDRRPFGWQATVLIEHYLYGLIAAGLLVAAIIAVPGKGLVGRFLGLGPLKRIGEVSYGVYLWHLMVLVVFAGAARMGEQVKWIGGTEGLVGGLPGVAVAFAVTTAVSVLSWRFLEKRLIERSHRTRR